MSEAPKCSKCESVTHNPMCALCLMRKDEQENRAEYRKIGEL